MTTVEALAAYNGISHAVLIALVVYLVYQQRRQDSRTDNLEQIVGYVKGRLNGTSQERL